METRESREALLYHSLSCEEFHAKRREAIRRAEAVLWDWNIREWRLYGREPLRSVEGRIKTPESILEKLRKKGYDISLEGVERLHDLAGVRAVCSYLDDVYRLQEYLLGCADTAVLSQKDYIAIPKKSGYQSLHMLLKLDTELVELQIRTVAMDCWSNLEHPAVYKKGRDADKEMGQKLIKYAGFLRRVDSLLVALRLEQEKKEAGAN